MSLRDHAVTLLRFARNDISVNWGLKNYLSNCLLVQMETADSSALSLLPLVDNLLTNNPAGKIPANPKPARGNPVFGNSFIEVPD